MTAIIIGMTIIVLSKVFQLHKPRNVDLVSKPGIIINIINYFPKIAPFLILIINTLPLFWGHTSHCSKSLFCFDLKQVLCLTHVLVPVKLIINTCENKITFVSWEWVSRLWISWQGRWWSCSRFIICKAFLWSTVDRPVSVTLAVLSSAKVMLSMCSHICWLGDLQTIYRQNNDSFQLPTD